MTRLGIIAVSTIVVVLLWGWVIDGRSLTIGGKFVVIFWGAVGVAILTTILTDFLEDQL